MATRREQLEIGIIASDKASSVIKGVADATDTLDGETAEVELTAEDNATEYIDDLMGKLDTLDSEDVEVILKAEAKSLTDEVARATKLLAKVDGEAFVATLDAKNNAQAKLDAVEDALARIDTTVTPSVGSPDVTGAQTELGKVRGSMDGVSDSSRSVFANFAGNAASELPGVAGAFGPLNMAIGQFVEYGSEGNINMKGLLKVAGPMAALGVGFGIISGHMDSIAKKKAFNEKQVDAYAEAIGKVGAGVEAANLALRDTEELIGILPSEGLLGGLFGQSDEVDVAEKLAGYGVALDDVARIIADTGPQMERMWIGASGEGIEATESVHAFGDALIAAGVPAEDVGEIVEVLAQQQDAFGEATERSSQMAAYFATDIEGANAALDAFTESTDPIATMPETWQTLANAIKDGTIATEAGVDAFNEIKAAFPEMSDAEVFQHATELLEEQEQAAADSAAAMAEQKEAATEAAEVMRDEYVAALEETAEQLEENIALLDEQIEGFRSSVDAEYAMIDAKEDAVEAYEAVNEAIEEHGIESEEAEEALADFRDTVIDAVDATVRLAEEEAKANGVSLTRVQRIDAENDAYLEQARTVEGPARNAILAHVLRINGIPEERITEILTDTDPNDLAQTEAELDGPANKRRVASIEADANDASLAATKAQIDTVAAPRRVPIVAALDAATYYDQLAVALRKRSVTAVINTARNATGNPVYPGGVTLVGEQGPELVALPQGSEIVPNHRLDTVGGSVSNYYVSNTINQPAGIRDRDTAAAIRRYSRIQGAA
jgi:hypothetical protein